MSSNFQLLPKKTTKAVAEACVQLYPSLLKKYYQAKHPKKNLEEILGDDEWRYTGLPAYLADKGDDVKSLTKDQLARLVKWKITHGANRPFLPVMVQKNSSAEVEECTSQAYATLGELSRKQDVSKLHDSVNAALDKACKLKGVGPATGALVLSVFNPGIVPFFEDELFGWLVPEKNGSLKYDKKEYSVVLERALQIMLDTGVGARDMEKIAFVIMHEDLLNEQEKNRLLEVQEEMPAAQEKPKAQQASMDKNKQVELGRPLPRKARPTSTPDSTFQRRKAGELDEDVSTLRRSKRKRQA